MALTAVHGIDHLESRSLAGFQQAGVFKNVGLIESSIKWITDAVASLRHPRRLPSPLGPYVFVAPSDSDDKAAAFQVGLLLLDKGLKERKAALRHIDSLATAGHLTDRSQQTIAQNREALLSTNKQKWQPAGIAIFDALEEDWLCCLAGLHQALACRFDEGIQDYLNSLLYPPISAVASLDVRWWQPATQRAEIEQEILHIVEKSATLASAAESYFQAFGHLPFAPDLAMSRVVSEWQERHGSAECAWSALWSWAEKQFSPLSRYHVCQVLLSDPSLIPSDQVERFWQEIAEILAVDESGQWFNNWHLKCEVALHYCHYLEQLLPWHEGEGIAILSWWLADRFSSLFAGSHANLNTFRGVFFGRTYFHWHLTRARITNSEFRYRTLFNPSLWQRSILSQCASGFQHLGFSAISEKVSEAIEAALIIQGVNDPHIALENSVSETVYAMSYPLDATIDAWVAHLPEDERGQLFRAFFDHLKTLRDIPLDQRLSDDESLPDQMDLSVLRSDVYSDSPPIPSFKALLQDERKMNRLLTGLGENNLSILDDVLFELAASGDEDLRVLVPHAYASACLACSDDSLKNRLFLATVQSSVCTDSVSALKRLTSQDTGNLASLTRDYHKYLVHHQRIAPSWLVARLRAVICLLNK